MSLALSCLGHLLSRRVKTQRSLLFVLELIRKLKSLSLVEVLRLHPLELRLRRSLENLLRNPRSDLQNLGWLLSVLSQVLLVESLVGLTPRLLYKVVLLKRLSWRDLVWSLHVLVEIGCHRMVYLLVIFAYIWLVSPLGCLVRLTPLALRILLLILLPLVLLWISLACPPVLH